MAARTGGETGVLVQRWQSTFCSGSKSGLADARTWRSRHEAPIPGPGPALAATHRPRAGPHPAALFLWNVHRNASFVAVSISSAFGKIHVELCVCFEIAC